MSRPPKLSKDDVIKNIRSAVNPTGRIRYSDHALSRMDERDITYPNIAETLEKGFHEPAKDKFENGCWRYAIRHNIKVSEEERKRLRIPVAFAIDDKGNVTVIVSAIDIELDEEE